MKRFTLQLILIGICNSSHNFRPKHQNPEELYKSHVFSHYLNSESSFLQPFGDFSDDSDVVNKRDVKLTDGGLFYHDGPYVSHSQVQRESPHFESYVTPLSEVYKTDPVPTQALFGRIQPQTSANPYTYAVHAVSVSPSHYQGPSAPEQYAGPFFAQSTPSPYYGPSSPSYVVTPPAPIYGPSTPAPYYRASTPISYRGPPTQVPNYGPSSPPLFYGLSYNGPSTPSYRVAPTPPPYQATPSPSYGFRFLHQNQKVGYLGTPLYQHHTSEYDPSINLPVTPKPNFNNIHEQVHHSTPKPSINVHSTPNPYNYPPKDFHKAPAISFFDSPRRPSPHLSPGSNVTIHKDNHLNPNHQHHKQLPLSPEQPAVLPHQASSLFSNLVNDQQPNMALAFQKETKHQPNQNQLSNPNQQHSLGLQLFAQHMQEPRQHKSIQFKSSLNEIHTNNIHQQTQIQEIPQAQQTLFQSVNQEAPDRPVHKKLTHQKSKHNMPKSDALQRLMAIAGDDWDVEIGIEKNLLDTSSSSFICPGPEGDFPSPSSCSVYYQCAQGTPHKHSCEAGLRWNMDKNQCDWEHNVDCDRNKRMYRYF